jgi:hypothetical protein
MKSPALSKFIVILFLFFSSGHASIAQVYRWDVKLAIDTAGLRIYKKHKPEAVTVKNLGSPTLNPKPPQTELNKGKRSTAEKRIVTVTGYITATGLEDDGDYHLVVNELTGNKTLIAEIPDEHTPKLQGFPGYRKIYSEARKEVNEKIGKPPAHVKPLAVKYKAKLTGFVFYDKRAHGNGHAANDVEIHPVLSIKIITD